MKPSDLNLTDARAAVGAGGQAMVQQGEVRLDEPHTAPSNVFSADADALAPTAPEKPRG